MMSCPHFFTSFTVQHPSFAFNIVLTIHLYGSDGWMTSLDTNTAHPCPLLLFQNILSLHTLLFPLLFSPFPYSSICPTLTPLPAFSPVLPLSNFPGYIHLIFLLTISLISVISHYSLLHFPHPLLPFSNKIFLLSYPFSTIPFRPLYSHLTFFPVTFPSH